MRRGIPVRTHWVPLQFFLVAAGFQQYPATVSEGVTVMNVSRSTFVWRGCVLTALAVTVLLAGFSGTAWAQTNFTLSITRSAELKEGASTANSTSDRTLLTITHSNPQGSVDHDRDGSDATPTPKVRRSVFGPENKPSVKLTATCNGVLSATGDDCDFDLVLGEAGGSLTGTIKSMAGVTLGFADTRVTTDDLWGTIERKIELLVSHAVDDGDWNEETVVLTLEMVDETVMGLDEKTYTFDPARKATSTLKILDDDLMPKLKFDRPSIQLAKGNTQTMTVGVDISGTSKAKGEIRTTLNKLNGSRTGEGLGSSDEILLSVSPREAVGSRIKIYRDGEMEPDDGTSLLTDREGRYIVGTIGIGTDAATGAVAASAADAMMNDGIKLNITAIDVSGFRDEQITFTLMDGRTENQRKGDGGAIEAADPATVTLLSGEATPTVAFSKSSISIEEGGKDTVHLLADTDQGDQVGSATVSMSGDALISLRQGNSAISGGVVSFGGSANAELTIVSLSDPDLEDGEEKTATVTITDASGANIGEQRTLTVTVVGSTAVPVFPLFAQLLLALLLMVGGARLYRRRQG